VIHRLDLSAVLRLSFTFTLIYFTLIYFNLLVELNSSELSTA